MASTAQLIMDPSGGDSIVVLDSGSKGVHYIDLKQVVGFSVGPGSQLHVYLLGTKVTVASVGAAEGERIVERWLSIKRVH